MADYTPTTEEVRQAVAEWCWSRRMFRPELEASDGGEFDRWIQSEQQRVWKNWQSTTEFDSFAMLVAGDPTEADVASWLAAHDAEARASVLAEQGEPEWEYAWEADEAVRATLRPRGPRIMLDDVPTTPEAIANFPRGQRIRRRKAGPWLPVEENKPESTDGSER